MGGIVNSYSIVAVSGLAPVAVAVILMVYTPAGISVTVGSPEPEAGYLILLISTVGLPFMTRAVKPLTGVEGDYFLPTVAVIWAFVAVPPN